MAQITRNDSENGRTYTIVLPSGETVIYPSVTTVLQMLGKPWLCPWAAKLTSEYIREHLPRDRVLPEPELGALLDRAKKTHTRTKEEAGDIGTQAHALIEQHLKDGHPPNLDTIENLDPRVKNCVTMHNDWWRRSGFSVASIEVVVYHPIMKYAGTVDCVASDSRGNLLLLDWKTSNHMSPEYELQAVAYKYAYEHVFDIPLEDVYIVRVGKEDATHEICHVPVERHDYLFQVFNCVRQIYAWKEECDARKKSETAKKRAVLQAEKEALKKQEKPVPKKKVLVINRPV